jgi:NADPH-dependent 2,4-dienoyl-CoA reductase/sulfur reductase-like enzyme/rhodanese-related sulfurtransferase
MPDAEITMVDMDTLISYGGCGIPYYVSGDVSDEKELRTTTFHVTRDEHFFEIAKGVTVRTATRATRIDRQKKTVYLEEINSGKTDELPYDQLVLATGSRPNILAIPGADLGGVYTVADLHKAIAIKADLVKGKVGRAVIIGGGAIGIEMAEAFGDLWEVETTILEFMPQLLPRLVDRTFALMVEKHLRDKGVKIFTSEAAQRLEGDATGRVCRVVTPKRTIEADIVIMAVGVRPRSELAVEAGLLVSPQGGIVVNDRLQTSDPAIYAAGDCVDIRHLITGRRAPAPMGSLANREGRVVADNLAGLASTFKGWIGTFVLKAFDICVAATGISLETALSEGFKAEAVITAQSDRAHFFPSQTVIPLQMVFDRESRRVLGVQGFGPAGNDGVLARIDTAAALIGRGATIDDFCDLEMAYAPPFATAIDALNATANAAENLAVGRLRILSPLDFLAWMADLATRPGWVALDIRHQAETAGFVTKFGAQWLAIPYPEFRPRASELPVDRTFIILCDAGTRSYEVQCILDSIGRDSLVLTGGLNCIRRIGVDWWPE